MVCLDHSSSSKIRAHTPTGKTVQQADYHKKIDELVDKVESKVIEWRHDIHQHPELANREFRTAKLIADHLRSLNFDEVKEKVGVTGVVGVLKGGKPGKVFGLRADFDALPVKEEVDIPFASKVVDEDYPGGAVPVMHACGHDNHAAMLMGAAEVLANMREQIPGTVKFIFQPAEEGPPIDEEGGATLMIKEGAMENPKPDCVFGMHVGPYPNGTILYGTPDAMAASELIQIEIFGKQVHGSTPWMGEDPMPVAAEIITAIGQIYRQVDAVDPITISIGKVIDQGRFNIIGDKITLLGTTRCVHQSMMEKVNLRIDRIATNVAQAHGLTAKATFKQQVCPLINKPEWVDKFLPTIERVAGHDKIYLNEPMLGYDDVSEFIRIAGGMYVFLGGQDTTFGDSIPGEEVDFTKMKPTSEKGIGMNHNGKFYCNDEVLKIGVKLHANVVMDFLSNP
jgi:amidohydrolase